MSRFYKDKDRFDEEMDRLIAKDQERALGLRLRMQIDMFLPKMEDGSTFLDAGCHLGLMYHILINEKGLKLNYHGIDLNKDFVEFANRRFGPYFETCDILNHRKRYDYVWCSQMTDRSNHLGVPILHGKMVRHLAGLAKKKLVYNRVNNLDKELEIDHDFPKICKYEQCEVVVI